MSDDAMASASSASGASYGANYVPRKRPQRESYDDNDEPFEDSDDEAAAIEDANRSAPAVVDAMRELLQQPVAHCLYPAGTLTLTTEVDEELGLAIDPSNSAQAGMTVFRGFAGGAYDVVRFDRQPRATLVAFTHSAGGAISDITIGCRARALLRRDIDWCERGEVRIPDDDDGSDSSLNIGEDGRLVERATSGT
jgi:hypothetical protein